MFARNSEFSTGWHYTEKWRYYQKVNGRVFAAVSKLMYGYQAQLYHRGRGKMAICVLEVRTRSDSKYTVDDMFQIAEIWLQKYYSGDGGLLSRDNYHISNPNGVWGYEADKKLYWV